MTQDISGNPAAEPAPKETGDVASGAAIPAQRGDFAGDAGSATLRQASRDYAARLRGGEVGGLPAVLGLVVLLVVFSSTTKVFMTKGNMANLITQAGPVIFIAMGLVFVLLLGEIDLSAGTAAGLSSAGMAIAVNHNGDIYAQLKGGMFGAYVVCMILALAVAVWQRMWWAVALVGFGTVVLVTHLGGNQVIAMLLTVTTGTAIGALTGFLVARVRIPSFVVTLALYLAWQGVLIQFLGSGNAIPTQKSKTINAIENTNMAPWLGWLMLAVSVGGYAIYATYRTYHRRAKGLPSAPVNLLGMRILAMAVIGAAAVYFLNENRNPNAAGNPLRGVPWVVPLVLVVFVAMTLLLTKTSFGRHLYASGGNAEGALRAGIDVPRMRISAFTISTTLAGIGGVVLASHQGGVPSDAGSGGSNILLYAVGAAVIGGTSLFGGRGRVRDAVLGGLVITVIPNGLQLHVGVGASYQYVITGGYLLLAAAVDALSRSRRRA